MLKRISGTFSQSSDHLVPPPRSPSGATIPLPSPPNVLSRSDPSPSPSYPFPYTPASSQPTKKQQQLDRPTLHKTLAALSALLVALDELRESNGAQAKAQKRVAKAVKELAGCWGDKVAQGARDPVVGESSVSDALLASAGMYETLADVDAKHAKAVQQEYESINEVASKYFKKTAKEEKAYDEAFATLDGKVSKATSSYNKLSASSSRAGGMHKLDTLTSHHTAYMTSLHTLQSQASSLQSSYAEQIGEKRLAVGREVGRVACVLAERAWRNRVEGTRKGGERVGRVMDKGVWCEAGMGAAGEWERGGMAGAMDDDAVAEEQERAITPQAPQTRQPSILRGPRAPSTSTTNTQTSNAPSTGTMSSGGAQEQQLSHPLPAPSSPSSPAQTHSSPQPAPARSPLASAPSQPQQRQPPRTATCSPPAHSPSTLELDGGRTLPRGWYLDPSFANHHDPEPSVLDPAGGQRRDSAGTSIDPTSVSAYPTSPRPPLTSPGRRLGSPPGDGELRKPMPRYASAPVAATSTAQEAVDEFGRSGRAEGGAGGGEEREGWGVAVDRQASFVARMSAKYSSTGGAVAEGREERERGGEQPGERPSQPASQTHVRSASRVQQLAKRYSSPPEPSASGFAYPSPVSPDPVPTSTSGRRPLPPTHRHSSSLQLQTPPHRPSFGISASYQTPARSFTSHSPSTSSSFNEHPDSRSRTTSSSTAAHTAVCACSTCTSLKYGSGGAGGEGVGRDEEERMQRALRGSEKGSLEKALGKARDVWGRMG
ncbi:hypothetical protein JCM1840_001897 [Sporobolomyces johnsonii]